MNNILLGLIFIFQKHFIRMNVNVISPKRILVDNKTYFSIFKQQVKDGG